MTNREAQKELCRATKNPEEAYRIALSYERENKYAKTYVMTGGTASSSTGGGGKQIKTEPEETIRGGYRSHRGRGRGQTQGRGSYRGGIYTGDRRCYNCDKPGFTREHMSEFAATNVTGKFCWKNGHFERNFWVKKNNRGTLSVGIIQG